ncbi:MAG: YbjQ family protein [Thermodesulfobacteriota bacterium]
MEQLIIFLILMAVGYTAGTMAERKHYKSIEAREQAFLRMPAVTFWKTVIDESAVRKAELVSGSAVIAVDYFKQFLAGLRNIFGGNVRSYESLIDRARREAILRMKEAAGDAAIIVNVRLETSTIGQSGRKQKSTCVEVLAYGTALTLQ